MTMFASLWNAFVGFLDKTLVVVLKPVLDPLHDYLNGLPPAVWRTSVCVFLALGIFWTLVLRKDSVFRGAPASHWWCDLRLWACALAIPYLTIYLIF